MPDDDAVAENQRFGFRRVKGEHARSRNVHRFLPAACCGVPFERRARLEDVALVHRRWDRAADDDLSIIRVSRTWDDVAQEVEPKSKKGKRTVPVPSVLREALRNHKTSTRRKGNDLVFGTTPLKPFSPTSVNTRARTAWSAHYACGCTRKPRNPKTPNEPGLSLERIGDYVGHNSTYMVDRYRHLLDGHEAETAKRFDDYLKTRTDTRP